jgi:hypothetical protein
MTKIIIVVRVIKQKITKISKYYETATNNDRKFLAFIMEQNGYINKDGVKFLESLAKRASVIHSIPELNYP